MKITQLKYGKMGIYHILVSTEEKRAKNKIMHTVLTSAFKTTIIMHAVLTPAFKKRGQRRKLCTQFLFLLLREP